MGNNRPIQTKCFIAFLLAHGCTKKRTTASHDHYKCPNCWRTITVREKDKDIPPFHIKTNVTTMGKTLQDVYDWAEKNC